ncbi:MAG TPA: hypothetical protein VH583_08690 [Vicinamibacterales bacterium]|jgi:uncharacterized protein (UPF0147 family)
MADEKDTVTVDRSLEMLSEAVGKATEDLRAVRDALDQARRDVVSRNTSIPRRVVTDAEQAITHLRQTDESLKAVLAGLAERD